jgi:hypothetical protein
MLHAREICFEICCAICGRAAGRGGPLGGRGGCLGAGGGRGVVSRARGQGACMHARVGEAPLAWAEPETPFYTYKFMF